MVFEFLTLQNPSNAAKSLVQSKDCLLPPNEAKRVTPVQETESCVDFRHATATPFRLVQEAQ